MKLTAQLFLLIVVMVMAASVSAGVMAEAAPVDDGFAPGLLLIALFFCAVMLVLIGIGIVVGLVGLACTAFFITVGVISSSALIAILKRRFSAGLRALHYQVLALAGVPCGVGAWWLGCALFNIQMRYRYILAAGSASGIAAGIVLGFILDKCFQFVYRKFTSASV